MSFRYKSAIVSLVSLVIGYGWYFAALLAHHGSPGWPVGHLVGSVFIVTVLQIVGHILIAVTSKDRYGKMDERELAFDRRATTVGYQMLIVGALCAAATIHIGFGAHALANCIVLAIVVAECARQLKFLVLHHTTA